MGEWKDCTLGDIITLQRGHDLPKTQMADGKIPVAGSNGIIGYHNKSTTKGIGVTIGRSGNLGNSFLWRDEFWAHNTTLYVKDFKGNNEIFVYYFLKTIDFKSFNVGSAVPTLNRNHVYPLEVSLPPLPEQTAIAAILSSLDDKIDLLHRQNATLEKMAETLFRKWFVEEAKEEWEEKALSDFVNVKYGKDHKSLADGTIPVYGSGGLMRYAEKALYEKESVLIPRKGTLNNIMYQNDPFWTVDTMFYTEMKKPNVAKFVYYFLKDQDLASMNVGSAVPSMTTEVLNNMPILTPPDYVFEKFENAVSPLFKKSKSDQTQIRTLTALRDTLLPKLMSGEVRVKM
ncbi:restriction endonuclease subunit S [Flavobacterium longum]|uniref:restriction endonuclease subunit S n=1 Tax=Flavobacterium longum TaxID=1299340 RepID=UPI0039EC5FAB